MDAEKAEKIAARMKKGLFTLEDMAEQLHQMQRMGGMSGVLGMLPGMGKMKKQAAGQLANMGMDDRQLARQAAIVSSMTPSEKENPKVLNASRKRRIAAGSGTSVQDVNRVLKMHRQMADMMKKLGKGSMKGMANMLGAGQMGGGSGLPDLSAPGNGLPDLGNLKPPSGLPPGLGLPPKKK